MPKGCFFFPSANTTGKNKPQALSWLETFAPLAHEWNLVWEQYTILFEEIIQIRKSSNCYLAVRLLQGKAKKQM